MSTHKPKSQAKPQVKPQVTNTQVSQCSKKLQVPDLQRIHAQVPYEQGSTSTPSRLAIDMHKRI
jgi:hypothetical protein